MNQRKNHEVDREKSRLRVSNVRLKRANPRLEQTGLVGWISCTLNGALLLDGLCLRRTLGGRWTVGFPARKDGQGRIHHYIQPLDEHAQREIETQILAALGLQGAA
jgi:DNA-binding cell septation regulator SpoVG